MTVTKRSINKNIITIIDDGEEEEVTYAGRRESPSSRRHIKTKRYGLVRVQALRKKSI